MKPSFATIWEWGDEFKDAGRNCEKYISKRWNETIRECVIDVVARKRDEGIYYHITGYTSDSKTAGSLAQDMFDAAFYCGGNVRVEFVTVELFNSIISKDFIYRKAIENVRKEFEEFKQAVASRFISDPKVKEVAEGKKVEFLVESVLLCELEPVCINKLILEANHFNLGALEKFIYTISDGLIKGGLAKKVLGYELHIHTTDLNDLEIEDIGVWKDKAVVRLEWKSLRATSHRTQ